MFNNAIKLNFLSYFVNDQQKIEEEKIQLRDGKELTGKCISSKSNT